jgi:DNA-directed RNA polymerase subunit K/omega
MSTTKTAAAEAKNEDRIDSETLLSMLRQGLGKYLYVNLISKRCKQIITGSPKLSNPGKDCCLLADVAAAEVVEGKLSVRPILGNKLVNALDAPERMTRVVPDGK